MFFEVRDLFAPTSRIIAPLRFPWRCQHRLARFEREAQVLASLNHPNIAAIHGLEESDAVRALVLEYIDGPAADATDQVRA